MHQPVQRQQAMCAQLGGRVEGSDHREFGRAGLEVRDDCVLDAKRCYIDTPRLHLIGRMHGRGWYTRTSDLFLMDRMSLADWQARR